MYKCFTISSVEEIVDAARKLGLEWVYRGQSDSRWLPETSLRRALHRAGEIKKLAASSTELDMKFREEWLLYHFKRSAHHFLARLPEDNRLCEWLAILQQHGAPTRLLDFTNSFYVALHFAVSAARGEASIWAINSGRLYEEYAFSGTARGYHITDFWMAGTEDADASIARSHDKPGILFIQSKTLNPRQAAQQGCFLAPRSLDLSFVQNVAAHFSLAKNFVSAAPSQPWAGGVDKSVTVLHLKIHAALVPRELPAMLLQMNISEATLFPGLDGFTRSIFQLI